MKPLILTLILVTLVTPAICFGEWTRVGDSVNGNTYYVDFERIREHGGHVYFWQLTDFTKPLPSGSLSTKVYNQGDCGQFRYIALSFTVYKQPMGKGPTDGSINKPDKDWSYPIPNSVAEFQLKAVCDYVELDEKAKPRYLQYLKE